MDSTRRPIGRGSRMRARSPRVLGGRSSDSSYSVAGTSSVAGPSSVTVASSSSPVEDVSYGSQSMSSLTIGSAGGASTVPSGVESNVPRGARRGFRSNIPDLVHSRPQDKPKMGKKGVEVPLTANYYSMTVKDSWALHEYLVEFSPDEDRKFIRKVLLREATAPLNMVYIFDGSRIYTSKILEVNGQSALNGPVNFNVTTKDGNVTSLTIRHLNQVPSGGPIYFTIYNLLIRKAMFAMELEELGRHFFDHKASIRIDAHRLELWPGYITSIRHHEKKVLLCVEVTHKVLRMDNIQLIIKSIERAQRGDQKSFQAAVHAELKDTIVLTTYNRKTYHVDDIDFSANPMSTFKYKDTDVTYADYYKQRYGLVITDMKQPLIISRPSKKDMHKGITGNAVLIPELCQSTGLTDVMRSNFTLMKELGKHLHQGPVERVKAIEAFMKRLRSDESIMKEFDNWGITLSNVMEKFNGRILPRETMVFATGVQPVDDKGDFTMAFRSQKMLSTVNLKNWVLLVPQRDAAGVTNLVGTMIKVSAPLNMVISKPTQILNVPDPKIQTYLRILDDVLKQHADLQMIFVILPTNKADLYGAVKKRLTVDVGTPSQCFLAKNVNSKGLMSIATKVVVQMNAKLGGEPWTTKLPLPNTMFIGFDVYHGAKGSKGGSVGAMVASFAPAFTKYYSTTSYFHSSDELSKNMQADITKCLAAFFDSNGDLPERIFMYRDGVGEGQLAEVFTVELDSIKSALKEMYASRGKAEPKFTYIVVTKKINTRLFMSKGRYDNPPPGTIADDVVTLPERYDFYLISCAARQGTVSPCCYNVLLDESGMEADRIQLITYKLCHMYFNWSGTIAVPAPCQYAHKLAFLTGIAYQGHANPRLNLLLHFL